jgi:hypothetical protein
MSESSMSTWKCLAIGGEYTDTGFGRRLPACQGMRLGACEHSPRRTASCFGQPPRPPFDDESPRSGGGAK